MLDKLIHVAARLRADTIALLNGADEPWNQKQLARLLDLRAHQDRPDGVKPKLLTIVGLIGGEPTIQEH